MKDASAGNTPEQGNSTLEIIIALAILTVTLVSIILVTFGNQTAALENPIADEALALAKTMIEKAYAMGTHDFSSVIASSSVDGLYTKRLSVSFPTQCQKEVTSSIDWATDPSRPETISLATDVMDLSLGGDCASLIATRSWSSSQAYGGIDLGIAIPSSIDSYGDRTFIAAVASVASSPDLFIIDTHDITHPSILGTVDIGPGINAIDAARNYVFAANNTSTNQLQVIDISDTAHPTLIGARSLPGVSGANPQGRAIFYSNAKIYIGTKRTVGNELHIYDVSTPSNPINLGHVEVNYNVNAIAVQGTTAYLAVSAGAANSLLAYDVTDPSHIPTPIGMNPCLNGGKSLFIVGTALYLGCAKAPGSNDFFILDISTPTHPTIIGSTRVGSDINGLRVAGALAFLATTDPNREFQVWNISHPSSITFASSTDMPKDAVGIDYQNASVFLGIRSNDPLRLMTSN